MKGRDVLRDLVGEGKPKEDSSVPIMRPSGAVKAMSLGLERLSEDAAAAKSLRVLIAEGNNVVEIDPSLVDPAIISDRIPSDIDPEYDALKSAIELNGQQVPILVRHNPRDERRYQAAYGHRRLKVALELGRKIKAIVSQLTDRELLVAQAQENGPRLDLSFIERAMFAARMESNNYDRETIGAALGVDKTEVSKLLSVVGAIDHTVIYAIGPATKVGRPRWLILAEKLAIDENKRTVSELMAHEAFTAANSNKRFALIFDSVSKQRKSAKVQNKINLSVRGMPVALLEKTDKTLKLTSINRSFNTFMNQKIPELLKEFEALTPE